MQLFQRLNFFKLTDICTFEIAKKMYCYQNNPELHLPFLSLKSHKPTIITAGLHQKIIMFFQINKQNLEKIHLLTLDLKFGLKYQQNLSHYHILLSRKE